MARMRLGRLIAISMETNVSLRDCSRQGSVMFHDGRCCSNFTSALITQQNCFRSGEKGVCSKLFVSSAEHKYKQSTCLAKFLFILRGETHLPYGLSVPSLSPCSLFNTALKAGSYRHIKTTH